MRSCAFCMLSTHIHWQWNAIFGSEERLVSYIIISLYILGQWLYWNWVKPIYFGHSYFIRFNIPKCVSILSIDYWHSTDLISNILKFIVTLVSFPKYCQLSKSLSNRKTTTEWIIILNTSIYPFPIYLKSFNSK